MHNNHSSGDIYRFQRHYFSRAHPSWYALAATPRHHLLRLGRQSVSCVKTIT